MITISSEEYRAIGVGGAIIGALVGHVMSRKLSGSTVNRVLGTAAGGIIGSKIEKSMSPDTTEIQDCRIEHPSHQESYVSGYNVSYTLDGRPQTSFLSHDGEYIKLKKSITYRVLR
jgi:uncharacterized protein YcfJ